MIEAKTPVLLANGVTLWLVSLLTIILLSLANLPWQLEDYDQAKQAFTSWQIVKSGRVLYQETPVGAVATKPPLVGWISALLYEGTRSWDAAWRLPSLVAALIIAGLLWRRAAALFGRTAGVIALSAFAFNLLTPRLATLVRTDMPLALVTFLIALLFFEKVRAHERWHARGQAALFALLSASLLIKGPIVYAFVLPAVLLFWWRYRADAISRVMATGWWPWVMSLTIFIAWVAGGIKSVPGFYDEVVLREFVGRFGETIHRPQPLYFYLPHLVHKWAPWSLLLIGLLVANSRATHKAGKQWLGQLKPEIFWLLAWSMGGLLVMSCIPSKRVDRIFPVVPPLCFVLGVLIAQDSIGRHAIRLAGWCKVTLVAAILFAGSYTLFKVIHGIRKERDALVKCGREFRVRAAQNHWRYGIIKEPNEALVMYLDLPAFIDSKRAVVAWNRGEFEALLGSEKRMQLLLPDLKPSGQIRLDAFCHRATDQERYTVATHAR